MILNGHFLNKKAQIKNLHMYQENYDIIVKKTRDYTYKGLIILLILLISSIIINVIEIFFNIPMNFEMSIKNLETNF
jgi:hypothetical protein